MTDRVFSPSFWTDEYTGELEPLEKLLYAYLFTNSHLNVCGLYELPIKAIQIETGLDKSFIIQTLSKFQADKKIYYQGSLIFIPTLAKRQKAEKLGFFKEHVLKCAKDASLSKEDNIAYTEFKNKYKEILDNKAKGSESVKEELSKGLSEGFNEGLDKPLITITNTVSDSVSHKEGGTGETIAPESAKIFPLPDPTENSLPDIDRLWSMFWNRKVQDMGERLKGEELLAEYGKDKLVEAMKEASAQSKPGDDKRCIAYIRKILSSGGVAPFKFYTYEEMQEKTKGNTGLWENYCRVYLDEFSDKTYYVTTADQQKHNLKKYIPKKKQYSEDWRGREHQVWDSSICEQIFGTPAGGSK